MIFHEIGGIQIIQSGIIEYYKLHIIKLVLQYNTSSVAHPEKESVEVFLRKSNAAIASGV